MKLRGGLHTCDSLCHQILLYIAKPCDTVRFIYSVHGYN